MFNETRPHSCSLAIVCASWRSTTDDVACQPEAAAGLRRAQVTIHVVKAGMYTTVQDRGRPGWQHDGVPVGGAMDDVGLRIANWLLGNDGDAAVLEATLRGPSLTFDQDARIAITGADMEARIGERRVPTWWASPVRAGETLTLGT